MLVDLWYVELVVMVCVVKMIPWSYNLYCTASTKSIWVSLNPENDRRTQFSLSFSLALSTQATESTPQSDLLLKGVSLHIESAILVGDFHQDGISCSELGPPSRHVN